MILIIDNYDSFTYNLYQYIRIFTNDAMVVRNDKITVAQVEELAPDKIVISPGPKNPKEAGICVELIQHLYKRIPILGICLGHQCIGEAFGGDIVYAKELMHGKQALIEHIKGGIFQGLESPVKAARYHSLAVDEATLPDCLEVTARTKDGEIMAVHHKHYPVIGLQFHPESIYTEHGKRMIENFVNYNNIVGFGENI